jgi:hypothetical protein
VPQPNHCIWPSSFALYKPLSGRDARGSTMSILLMNNDWDPAVLTFVWADIFARMGMDTDKGMGMGMGAASSSAVSTCTLYDVWARKSLGTVSTQGSYETAAPVASRDSFFLTLSDCH